MTMADRIVVMRDGNIEQIGSPMDLYDDPRNLFVAGFIGSPTMNRIPGSIDGGLFVATGGFPIAEASPTLPPDVGPVICCVRPHEIAPGDTGTAASVVVVVVVEPSAWERRLS